MGRWSRIWRGAILAVLLSAASAGAAVEDFLAGTHYSPAANLTMPYRLFVPDQYDPDRDYPLILFLHGAGRRGTDNVRQVDNTSIEAMLEKVREDSYAAFILAPQAGPETNWSNNNDSPTPNETAVMEILDLVGQEYSLDANRLYLTGQSLGGAGTWDMMCRFRDRFAAGVPVCGWGDTSRAPLLVNKPIWAFHAADDNTVSVVKSRNMINSITVNGGSPLYTEYETGGHAIWGRAYREPELFPWLFAQSLPVPGMPGDANRDGVVTDADYTVWADHFGAVHALWEMGDFDGSEIVSMADYAIWAANYGRTEASGLIPEPVAALSLLAGLLWSAARKPTIHRIREDSR